MMMKRCIGAIVFAAGLTSTIVGAHEGHDDGPKVGATTGAVPRIAAHSGLFELVGIVEHGAMTLYLDRYADNAPVKDARIEIEAGTEKGVATPNADGTYTFKSALFGKPAPTSVTFTVSAGADTDLLAGDLTVAQAGTTQDHDAASGTAWTAWAAGAAIVLALAAGAALRMRRTRRKGL